MRVLVAEDDPALAASIERALTESGFAVDVVHEGESALWRAWEIAYDVITLDVMMPGLGGWEVCRRLRDRGNQTPVLMLTARGEVDDEQQSFDVGADDYVRKPFSPGILVSRLHALARRGPAAAEKLQVGNLTLEPRRRSCEVDGVTVDLTAREFSVLEALIRRASSVVAKRELLDLVWGFEFEGDPNVVEVYVGYLRKKLDRAGAGGLITTVRGVGYRMGS